MNRERLFHRHGTARWATRVDEAPELEGGTHHVDDRVRIHGAVNAVIAELEDRLPSAERNTLFVLQEEYQKIPNEDAFAYQGSSVEL